MTVTFTGTQKGLSARQLEFVTHMLTTNPPELLIHGGCVGADAEVDTIAAMLNIPREVYPSNIPAKHGHLYSMVGKITVHPPMEPLKRNRLMVDKADGVIACPSSDKEVVRSGTWATVRYARRTKGEAGIIVVTR